MNEILKPITDLSLACLSGLGIDCVYAESLVTGVAAWLPLLNGLNVIFALGC